jgi:hypothetical protein
MNKALVLLPCVACGAPASVTVASATPTTTTTLSPPPPKHPLTLEKIYETKPPADFSGVALDGRKLLFDVKGALQAVDEHGPVAAGPASARRVAVGPDVFDPSSFAKHTPAIPKGLECDGVAYSLDVTRMSAYCHDAKGQDAVYLYDARSGAELGRFDEWHSAAPIRSGAITESGNFIFWSARASGSFQEIKSRVIGPMMSSLSSMSPDETMLFTTPNKQWYTDDTTPAKILDPKNGRVLYELGNDVTSVTFAPKGGLFAEHHSTLWHDMNSSKSDVETMTVHETATDFVQVDGTRVVFGQDGTTLAALSKDVVRVFLIKR